MRFSLRCALLALLLSLATGTPVPAATAFADPAFQRQWQQGEATTPNFWGPLATAGDGIQEPYKEATGGQRLVQYFDKGRMELTNGKVTNGLLATELFKQELQLGDATFQSQSAPNIPIAGDPDNPGPTYTQLAIRASSLFYPTSPQPVGFTVTTTVDAGGSLIPGGNLVNSATTIATFDAATKHNVPGGFARYRDNVGVSTIGYAIAEPFLARVQVAGTGHLVMVQVFERRVLTYTPENPDPYKVEMGNIGLHYSQWRYGPPFPAATSIAAPSGLSVSPLTLEYTNVGHRGAPAILSFTASALTCLGYEVRRIGGSLPATDWMQRAPARCAAGVSFIKREIVDTGDKLEYRGSVRDLAGNTVYTPNTVVADGTTPPA